MSLPPRNKRHAWLKFDAQDYTNSDIQDFESMLGRIYDRQVHQVQVLDFDVLMEDMDRDTTKRLRIKHIDTQGQALFSSYAWRALFGIRRPLIREADSLKVIASKAELRD
ncbi:hypothetical protein Tco_0805463 [Tanacetum coccineum]